MASSPGEPIQNPPDDENPTITLMLRPVPAEMSEMDSQVLELLNSYFDEQEENMNPEGWVSTIRECFSEEIIDGMSIAWKVYVRRYLAEKGVVFPRGIFVHQALTSILQIRQTPSAERTPKPNPGTTPAQTAPSFAPVTPAPVATGSSAPTAPATIEPVTN